MMFKFAYISFLQQDLMKRGFNEAMEAAVKKHLLRDVIIMIPR